MPDKLGREECPFFFPRLEEGKLFITSYLRGSRVTSRWALDIDETPSHCLRFALEAGPNYLFAPSPNVKFGQLSSRPINLPFHGVLLARSRALFANAPLSFRAQTL